MDGGPTCRACGHERDDLTPNQLAGTSPRPPCSNCGATSLSYAIGLAEELGLNESLSTVLTPGDQSRGWKRRWSEVSRSLEELVAPRSDIYSAEGIHAARHDLHSFYIHAYHLKDALKQEAGSTGVPEGDVEDAITNIPELALLSDLANLDKHGNLNRRPRSGDIPKIVRAAGKAPSGPDAGWQLILEIEHRGKRLDGIEVAKAAVEAWRARLRAWKLI